MFFGLGKKKDLAVHAGIKILAVSMVRMFYNLEVVVAHVNYLKCNAIVFEYEIFHFLFSALFILAEKGGNKVKCFHFYPLIHDDPAGYNAVKSSGEKG